MSTVTETVPDEVPCVVRPATAAELDEAGYRAANPDVARSGESVEAHFRTLGQAEGRVQWVNTDTVRRMRAEKLRRVGMRDDMPLTRMPDGALNALSPEVVRGFNIPDDVPVSAHPYGTPVIELIQRNRDKLFLDLGAGLRHTYYANVVNTDIYDTVCTDVMCVGEALPFESEQFDFILCFAVLEHTKRPWDVAREMCRVLKPGGTLMVDWPFLQPVHGYPHHYYNATPQGNRSLFEEFCDVISSEIAWHHHPAISVHWILTAWRNGLPPRQAKAFEALTVGALIETSPDEQMHRDYCTELHPELKKAIAAGSLITAVKRQNAGRITAATMPASGPNAADNGRIASLESEIAGLRLQLDALRQSTSWRVTEPLRSAGRWLRRVRR
ncbi:MAG: hypothetical protein B7Z80_22815 [Rhodospirillales bacterium 20-64-7]|nr:MAG: hypothetical protein B7Z80_22815 [Rhodospirillales bacterium 20-64-7]HQT79083.1 class I SAM-dependent methyltransferase [Rhodopila sp.]